MKLAVTDACIFIDLCDLRLNSAFFRLNVEVHTSLDVFNELYADQQQLLMAYQSVGKLTIHSLDQTDRLEIFQENYPRSLSMVDKTVLHLARKLNAILLSGDKAVRQYGKKRAIEYHGMLWIFDQLIENKILNQAQASAKLKELLVTNFIYQHSAELTREIQNRLKKWNT
ncbi:PIN domain-containing protein [Mucilaginibacter glaciei]|uniref:PIN domain-containing protein n=1 Tax=Mucilaginibacter glaciei TaxID=2772109 RepID=A0A926NSA1_9SPHI|nr:hypothetical protein [Mucilaginibacter glaciei]MBD1395131.1 hypothetical protein [Mucilaginibacter glaciei]